MFMARAVIVVVILFAIALAGRLYRAWRARVQEEKPIHPLVPDSLRAGADRTWVVFTSPYCATCGPVEARLRASDRGARVVKVDATREPHLADSFSIRTAPTALLADGDGNVTARLVGAEAVDEYLRPAARPATG
ncbi:MAG TPA: thioredoxin family protein [Acidimicrobiales bacterium]|nr:thioredoxin family protein [Acidimicrobiales bacterium]